MSNTTSIEWTEHTWNPFVGCSIKSAGCTNCYAMKLAVRLEAFGQDAYSGTTANGVWTGRINRASDATFSKPLRIKRPSIFFVNSMSDFWHEGANDLWRRSALEIMEKTPHHKYQILTKRPELINPTLRRIGMDVPPNVWIGASVERRDVAFRADALRDVRAGTKFLSIEPLIGPIDTLNVKGIDWVITGGESGPGRRPCELDWVREARDITKSESAAFFHKQWGHYVDNPLVRQGMPISEAKIADPHGKGGALLDGVLWREFPKQPASQLPFPTFELFDHKLLG